ncbi:DUF87 domain-containing protein [Methanocaldococcus sp.]|uniref:helicase HerA domain-containing protein n=1 Tax=Methanocaldococcus sp. TaxID=2152917 RepID=UPI002633FF0B|nr:DUF87 domain-containing protein [Methanocaldococcus sp.]MCQ6253851.1 DUF87 domain-containing protein [Methanocaldococcus sp.]
MDRELVGAVITSKNVNEFKVEDQALDRVKCGEFVVVNNTCGELVLAKINRILSTNALIRDKLGDVDELSNMLIYSKKILEKSAGFIANAKILGVIRDNGDNIKIESNVYPIKVLEKVYLADDDLLKKIFSKGSIEIGVLKTREYVKVKLRARPLCSIHFAILAMTGAGKSNTVAIITQQLLEKVKGLINIIIIDPHGEYVKSKNGEYSYFICKIRSNYHF